MPLFHSDDADNSVRLVFGNDAAERDIEAFGRRFGCVVVDSYSSTENAVVVQRVPGAGYYDDLEADGYVHFAGAPRTGCASNGENLATAPIERVLLRHPDVEQAAVYAAPDRDGVGDQVMAALVLREGSRLDPGGLEQFLAAQPDLGTKSWPRWVRLATSLPQTATNKVLERQLASEHLDTGDPVWQRDPRSPRYHLR